MSKCKTYQELEDLVKSVNVDHHFELSENVHHAKMKFEVDTIAQHFYPSDGPQELHLVNAMGMEIASQDVYPNYSLEQKIIT